MRQLSVFLTKRLRRKIEWFLLLMYNGLGQRGVWCQGFRYELKNIQAATKANRVPEACSTFYPLLVCSVHCLASMSWHMESSDKKYQCILGFKETKDKTEVF